MKIKWYWFCFFFWLKVDVDISKVSSFLPTFYRSKLFLNAQIIRSILEVKRTENQVKGFLLFNRFLLIHQMCRNSSIKKFSTLLFVYIILMNTWLCLHFSRREAEWHVPVLSMLFFVLGTGNLIMTSWTIPAKIRERNLGLLKVRLTNINVKITVL